MAGTVREGPWAGDAVLARLREKERPGLVGKAEVLIFNILLFCPLLSPMTGRGGWQGLPDSGTHCSWVFSLSHRDVSWAPPRPDCVCPVQPGLRAAVVASVPESPQSQLPGTVTGVTRFMAFSCVDRKAVLGKALDTHPNAVETDEQQKEPGLLHFVNTCWLP